MTFKVFNLGSKQSYFTSAYVVRVPIFSFMTVSINVAELRYEYIGTNTSYPEKNLLASVGEVVEDTDKVTFSHTE